MKVNVNLFTWLKEKKGKKNTQIFFFTMWCWRIQTFGVVLKTRKRCRSVFTVIHVSHSCKTAVWTIKMLLRSLLWFSDFFYPPVTSYPAWFNQCQGTSLPFKHILAKYQKSIFYFIFLNHCQCWYTMQLQVHQETDLTKNCWHRTWRSSVKLIKQLESFDIQAFYFVRLLTLSGIFCFLKFWVENVSCLCTILRGGSGDKTKTDTGCVGLVKAAWLNLSRAVQQMADFGAWRRCSSFSLSLQLQSHSGQRRHRRRQDAHVFWSVPSPNISRGEVCSGRPAEVWREPAATHRCMLG